MKILYSLILTSALTAAVLTAFCAEEKVRAGFRIDFSRSYIVDEAPKNWCYKGKPGTDKSKYFIIRENKRRVLKAEADKSTGSIIFDISSVNLKKYPVMRWKWKVATLPENADGRVTEKDDQAIGLYVGSGSTFSQKSYACRWETVTPKGTTGSAKYAMGLMTVEWICLRNNQDQLNTWYVDQCNIYQALLKIFDQKVPQKDLGLSISCNSQYTRSKAVAYLEWIEFLPEEAMKEKIK